MRFGSVIKQLLSVALKITTVVLLAVCAGSEFHTLNILLEKICFVSSDLKALLIIEVIFLVFISLFDNETIAFTDVIETREHFEKFHSANV